MTENRIKKLRELYGISQISLSARAGISQPYLHDLENNRRGAKPETLKRIADVFGISVDDLVTENSKEVN